MKRFFYGMLIIFLAGTIGCGTGFDDSGDPGPDDETGTESISRTRQIGGDKDDSGLGAAVDSLDNIYITGYTGSDLYGNIHQGEGDIFLIKFNSSGEQVWTRMLGSAAYDGAYDIAIDSEDNIYLTGWTCGSLDGNNHEGSYDVSLAKYNTAGEKLWTRQLGSTAVDIAHDVVIDSAGNVYIAGYTNGGLDGNTATGGHDAFLVKYTSSGEKKWTKQFGTTGDDVAHSVAVNSSDTVFVTGYTGGNLYGSYTGANGDIFLAMVSSDGISEYRQWGTGEADIGSGLAVDSKDNVYISGHSGGNLNGETVVGSSDTFLMKFNVNQVLEWTSMLGSTSSETVKSLIIDSNDNILLGGYTGNSLSGTDDAFILKYDSESNVLLTEQFGSTENDYCYDIALDSSGTVYVTGYTNGGSLDGNTALGGRDIFLTRFAETW
ncbi:MAG: hypothetical protein GY754_33880 [bacterium]|nr:hypothetical protein [bacterium]